MKISFGRFVTGNYLKIVGIINVVISFLNEHISILTIVSENAKS